MKIALCLHGYFNSLVDSSSKGDMGYEYIKKHLLDKYDVDIYIHSWEPTLVEKLDELYSPTGIKMEEQIEFDEFIEENGLDKLQGTPRSPQTILSHFYSIQESFKLLYESDNQYDIVIKSRFDLGQINRASSSNNVECINFNTSNPMDRINMAWWPDKWMINEGPPDMWFYGGYNTMKSFSEIFDSIKSYMKSDSMYRGFVKDFLKEGDISNASVLYKKFFEDNNLWENRNPLICEKN